MNLIFSGRRGGNSSWYNSYHQVTVVVIWIVVIMVVIDRRVAAAADNETITEAVLGGNNTTNTTSNDTMKMIMWPEQSSFGVGAYPLATLDFFNCPPTSLGTPSRRKSVSVSMATNFALRSIIVQWMNFTRWDTKIAPSILVVIATVSIHRNVVKCRPGTLVAIVPWGPTKPDKALPAWALSLAPAAMIQLLLIRQRRRRLFPAWTFSPITTLGGARMVIISFVWPVVTFIPSPMVVNGKW